MRLRIAYFRWPIGRTVAGSTLSFWLRFNTTGTIAGAFSFFLIGAVSAVLAILLSFGNAISNANKPKDMTPVWQRRFLTGRARDQTRTRMAARRTVAGVASQLLA